MGPVAASRFKLHLRGAEWFIYNRSAVYDRLAAVAELRAAQQQQQQQDDAARALVASLLTVVWPPPAKVHARTPTPIYMPLDVYISRGAVVVGNHGGPSLLILSARELMGVYTDVRPDAAADYHRWVLRASLVQTTLSLVANFDWGLLDRDVQKALEAHALPPPFTAVPIGAASTGPHDDDDNESEDRRENDDDHEVVGEGLGPHGRRRPLSVADAFAVPAAPLDAAASSTTLAGGASINTTSPLLPTGAPPAATGTAGAGLSSSPPAAVAAAAPAPGLFLRTASAASFGRPATVAPAPDTRDGAAPRLAYALATAQSFVRDVRASFRMALPLDVDAEAARRSAAVVGMPAAPPVWPVAATLTPVPSAAALRTAQRVEAATPTLAAAGGSAASLLRPPATTSSASANADAGRTHAPTDKATATATTAGPSAATTTTTTTTTGADAMAAMEDQQVQALAERLRAHWDGLDSSARAAATAPAPAATGTQARPANVYAEYARVATLLAAPLVGMNYVVDEPGPVDASPTVPPPAAAAVAAAARDGVGERNDDEDEDEDDDAGRRASGVGIGTGGRPRNPRRTTSVPLTPLPLPRTSSATGTATAAAASNNVAALPLWRLDLTLHQGVLHYGPWADRQRVALIAQFFPWDYETLPITDPAPALPGTARPFGAFKLNVRFLGKTTWRVPMREASKDHRYGPAGGTRWAARRYAWLDLRFGPGSTLAYELPMQTRADGYTARAEARLVGCAFVTSLNYAEVGTTTLTTLRMRLPTPRVWNGPRTGTVNATLSNARLAPLRDHVTLVQDLVADWVAAPPLAHPGLYVPAGWEMSVALEDTVQVRLNCNEGNVIDRPLESEDNVWIVLAAPRARAHVALRPGGVAPAAAWQVPFSADAPDGLEASLSLPQSHTVGAHRADARRSAGGDVIDRFLHVRAATLAGDYVSYPPPPPYAAQRRGATPNPTHIDTASLRIALRGVVATVTGAPLHYLGHLKANYAGAHVAFTTLEELRKQRGMGPSVPVGAATSGRPGDGGGVPGAPPARTSPPAAVPARGDAPSSTGGTGGGGPVHLRRAPSSMAPLPPSAPVRTRTDSLTAMRPRSSTMGGGMDAPVALGHAQMGAASVRLPAPAPLARTDTAAQSDPTLALGRSATSTSLRRRAGARLHHGREGSFASGRTGSDSAAGTPIPLTATTTLATDDAGGGSGTTTPPVRPRASFVRVCMLVGASERK
jgi:hypothetical protein